MKKKLLFMALSLCLCLPIAFGAGCKSKDNSQNHESPWSDENADVDGWT